MKKIIIKGKVIHGSGDGTKIGFPTANLEIVKDSSHALELAKLPHGVYACYVMLEGYNDTKQLQGVLHWGPRLVFQEQNPQIELHILSFEGDIYEKILSVEVVKFLRGSLPFANIEDLKKQIEMDCEQARIDLKNI